MRTWPLHQLPQGCLPPMTSCARLLVLKHAWRLPCSRQLRRPEITPAACVQHGTGQANTALVFHAKRLLSLYESDLPFAVRVTFALHRPVCCECTRAGWPQRVWHHFSMRLPAL